MSEERGGGGGELGSNTCKVSTWENGKTLKVDAGDGYIPTQVSLTPLNHVVIVRLLICV